MPRLALNKAQLAREKADLARFGRFLPSLDLKRKQLVAERARTQARIAELEEEIARAVRRVGEEIPMLANRDIDLSGLAALRAVRIREVNVVGQRLPALDRIEVAVAPYGRLTRPHWVDLTVRRLEEALTLRVELQVARRRLALLETAVTRVTQRVNLFEKILIPRARANIRRIRIAIGDMDRAAVVNSKIAKRKREAKTA